MGQRNGLIDENMAAFVAANARKLNSAINRAGDNLFDFFGLRTLYDRYLLRHPETRDVIETPQFFFLRIACGIYQRVPDALDFYRLVSSLDYLSSSPTLFNTGTPPAQLSCCLLLS